MTRRVLRATIHRDEAIPPGTPTQSGSMRRTDGCIYTSPTA